MYGSVIGHCRRPNIPHKKDNLLDPSGKNLRKGFSLVSGELVKPTVIGSCLDLNLGLHELGSSTLPPCYPAVHKQIFKALSLGKKCRFYRPCKQV